MVQKISNLFLIVGILGLLIIYRYNIYTIEKNEIIVSQIEKNGDVPEYYIGYIEIKDLNLKVPLVYGTTKKELDQNVVGVDQHSTIVHLILAGHAIPNVFLPLYQITIHTKIKIYFHGIYKNYIVDNMYSVNDYQTEVYQNEGLTLITCINNHTRWIVHAKTASY